MIQLKELEDAVHAALAICEEFEGTDAPTKLAAAGLDPVAVVQTLERRYLAHLDAARKEGSEDTDLDSFVQGWVEGVMTGAMLTRLSVTL